MRGSSRARLIGWFGLGISLALIIGCSDQEATDDGAADAQSAAATAALPEPEAAAAVDAELAGEDDPQAAYELEAAEAEAAEAEEAAELGELDPLAAGCNGSPASFAVKPTRAIGGPMVGFGAQFNANLFHPKGRFNQGKLGALAAGVRELRPQHVRIFFDSRALGDKALMESFSKTVALAQSTGATINVTWWHGPYQGAEGTAEYGKRDMEQFADVLEKELEMGHTAIKFVTVQNEPNRTRLNKHKKDLVTVYKNLHASLGKRGIRSRLKLVWEITRGYKGTGSWYKDWLKVVGPGLQNVLDGYAWHIYHFSFMWDKVRLDRLREVRDAVRALPAAQRKPIYVTEFGTRGHPDSNRSILKWPGFVQKNCTRGRKGCTLVTDSNVAGANNAWFQIAASRMGFRAFVYWDAYWTMYDKKDQQWSLISAPAQGLKRRPTYYVTKLFSHVVPVGWSAVEVSDPGRYHLDATAFRGDGQLTVIGANKSECGTTFRYSGLPSGKKFYEVVWNDDGGGRLCSRGLRTATGGKLNVVMKQRSAVALTTRNSGMNLPSCSVGITSVPEEMCGDGECTEGETDATCGADCGCGADSCGSVAPFGCYCDADCAATGDCCADVGV